MPDIDQAHQRRLDQKVKILEAAIKYAELGWSVLPLCNPWHMGMAWHTRGKDPCTSPGKTPVVRWTDLKDSPATVKQIRQWWKELFLPNVGVILGPVSGMIDIDVDGAGTLELLRDLCNNELPDTQEFHTPKGGYRYLYGIPDGFECYPKKAATANQEPGCEIRYQAYGSQTVMPPSLGWRFKDAFKEEGLVEYRWADLKNPWQIKLAMAPDWLLAKVEGKNRNKKTFTIRAPSKNGEPAQNQENSPIHETARNVTLTQIAGAMRKFGCDEETVAAALLLANTKRCSPPLEDGEVLKIANSIMRYNPDDPLGFMAQTPVVRTAPEVIDVDVEVKPATEPVTNPTTEPPSQSVAQSQSVTEPAAEPITSPPPSQAVVKINAQDVTSNSREDASRMVALEAVKNSQPFMRVGIQNIIKLGNDNEADFRIITNTGKEFSIGNSEGIYNPRKVRSLVFAATAITISVPKDHDWADLVEVIGRAAEPKYAPIGNNEETCVWLAGYCQYVLKGQIPPINMEDSEEMSERLASVYEAVNKGEHKSVPFVSTSGHFYIHVDSFHSYIRHPFPFAVKCDRRELSLRLRSLGFTPCVVRVRVGRDKRIVLRFWKSRENYSITEDS